MTKFQEVFCAIAAGFGITMIAIAVVVHSNQVAKYAMDMAIWYSQQGG